MKKLYYVKLVIGGIMLPVLFFCEDAFGFDDEDWQYWNTESISYKISDDWNIGLEEEFRYGDDMSNFYYNHTDIGAIYSGMARWFDLGFNYRHIYEEESSDWKKEHRPHVNGTIKYRLKNFSFSNRGRFEFREREDADEAWQYRNKISVKTPTGFTRYKIKPYLADELFFDSDSKELNRNRFYSGFSFQIFNNLRPEIYCLLQRSKASSTGKWSDYNIVGTKLKLVF
jgi:hypothetical protein